MARKILLISVTAATLAGCGNGFERYSTLDSFRLLGVRADPPTLAPGETGTLEALVYEPQGRTPSYSWSFCPLRAGAEADYACAITEVDFTEVLAQAGAPPVSFDLGNEPTTSFTYTIPPALLASLCAQGPGGCDQGFQASIGLTVRSGEEEITAFKSLELALDASQARNRNPSITSLRIANEGEPRESAVELGPGEASYTATLGATYELFADLPDDAAETFFGTATPGMAPATQREVLYASWFFEQGGAAAHDTTTFYEGRASFDGLAHNTWTLPQPEVVDTDRLSVFLVLHDNRGGVSWLSRQLIAGRP